MRFVADVHLHSHFSRATSKDLDPEHLALWAQRKGVLVIGTGDFAHPGWMAELEEKLVPAPEAGLFELKPDLARVVQRQLPAACHAPVRFMLSVEISNIYKRGGKTRRIHNLIFVPHFDAAKKLQARLESIGNIRSDGRPILGLDSRDLLEITLETDPLAYLIPAHIWTPWFSALGSKGGFDSMQACFADLTSDIFAVETGLSSDPPMNWRLSQLDPYVLVSNSDAHSPAKLGREATVYNTELSYIGIYNALSGRDNPINRRTFPSGVEGTIEFYPEEGKYHYDGHRACKVRLHPRETNQHGGLCPVCLKPLTIGVLGRVEQLADRPEVLAAKPPRARPFTSLVPLPEIIAEARQVGVNTKTVNEIFNALLSKLGNELYILREAPLEDIERVAGALIAEGIRRVRVGELHIAAGYDGEYGVIKIFGSDERQRMARQTSLIEDSDTAKGSPAENTGIDFPEIGPESHEEKPASLTESVDEEQLTGKMDRDTHRRRIADLHLGRLLPDDVNPAQWCAVTYNGGHLLIVAGPGTGKTHTLTYRIAHIIQCFASADQVLAMTFTNKAADEMRQRLQLRLKEEADAVSLGTFHRFCLHLLRHYAAQANLPASFRLATEEQILQAARELWPDYSSAERKEILEQISRWKIRGISDEPPEQVARLTDYLRNRNLFDFDDLLLEALRLLRTHPEIAGHVQSQYRNLFVDEYQDLNPAQHALLKRLAAGGAVVTAIGDPNQAIYGFRGADPRFFASFTKDFPGAKVLHLSDNYRSAKNILSASSQVITKHTAIWPTKLPALTAQIASRGRLTIHESPTEAAEAEYVVHRIEQLVGGTSMFSQDSGRVASEAEAACSFGDIAVLYRLNSQCAALEEAFERSGIPYQISGDRPLAAHPEVACILSMLELAAGVALARNRVVELVRFAIPGIGEKRALQLVGDVEEIDAHALAKMPTRNTLPDSARTALQTFNNDIAVLAERMQHAGISATLQHFMLIESWRSLLSRDEKLAVTWEKLTRLARLCSGLSDFIDELLLRRANDGIDMRAERVSLMTLHASKGLEFPVVFIVGCEDGLIPLLLPGYRSDRDEERRLFYVGMTRAKEQLFLLWARTRTLFGKTLRNPMSPFLADIEEALKEYDREATRRSMHAARPVSAQLELFANG